MAQTGSSTKETLLEEGHFRKSPTADVADSQGWVWGPKEALSECVWLIWAQPCQVPSASDPWELAKPSSGVSRVFRNDWPARAKTSHCRFLLPNDCSL